MVETQTHDETLFRQWHQLRHTRPHIEQELTRQGWSADEINSVLDHYARYRLGRRNTIGWSLMGLGGFMGLVSCVLTMLDSVPALRGFFMYGLTTLAIVIALYGCRLVFEKEEE